jgi:putative hydrolase of the HAD superfamily
MPSNEPPLKRRDIAVVPRFAVRGREFVQRTKCILFDWGNTLMRDFPEFNGPMIRWPRVETVEHVPDVLEYLHRTWMLALATNAADSSEEEIWAALARVDLNRFLDKVYCSSRIGHKKPSPEFFRYILNDLGLDRSSVFMVGDDFDSDVIGANRCGIRAVWYNKQSTEVRKAEMCQTIHDFTSLPEALIAFGKGRSFQ